MTWIKIEDLPDDSLSSIWKLLCLIRKKLKICAPSDVIHDLNYEDEDILKQLENTEKVLRIKSLDKTARSASVLVYKAKFNKFYGRVEKMTKKAKQIKAPVSFDTQSCVLKFGDKQYKPQRKRGRCELLKILWADRRVIKTDGIKRMAGSFNDIQYIKNKIPDFKTDRSVWDAIQDIKDKFKAIDAPLEIITQNGFMLEIKE